MKVLFDSHVFDRQVFGGISRYFVELNREINELGESGIICAPWNVNQYLKLASSKIGVTTRPIPKLGRLLQSANKTICSVVINAWLPDIIHHTYYDVYGSKKFKHVITVYDMIHEKIPSEFHDANIVIENKRKSIISADLVIAISESTRNDVLNYMNIAPEKVVTIHLAGSTQVFAHNKSMRHRGEYILYVGDRASYKNFEHYITACAQIKYKGDFLVFGGGEISAKECGLIKSLGLEKRVYQIFGNDSTLMSLYQYADLFVYPSKYEGFGIPLLEAIQNGCPVAASRIDPFIEILQDKATYFDPKSIESIAEGIQLGLKSNRPNGNDIENFNLRFSWRRCAIETLEAYKSIR